MIHTGRALCVPKLGVDNWSNFSMVFLCVSVREREILDSVVIFPQPAHWRLHQFDILLSPSPSLCQCSSLAPLSSCLSFPYSPFSITAVETKQLCILEWYFVFSCICVSGTWLDTCSYWSTCDNKIILNSSFFFFLSLPLQRWMRYRYRKMGIR